jgi:nucleoside-diphosphate-sugar epimerase
MRVLLTGATGFVGAHVVRVLVRDDCEVHALVRPTSNLFRIADIQSRLHLIQGDVRDLEALRPLLRSIAPEMCIHLGWCAKPGEYLYSRENIDLLGGTIRFATMLADIGCRRFVGIGTCFEYDTAAGYLSERTPLDPAFLYSAAKAGAFMILDKLALKDMSVAWARLFYVYGPFENEQRLVPSVVRALLVGEEARCTAGEQVRDYLHVEDAASAVCAVACSSLVGAINVGSGSPVRIADLVTTICDIVGRPDLVKLGALPTSKGDPRFVCANNQRLREEMAWRPRFGLRDGLRSTIDWWRPRVTFARSP